MGCDPRSRTCGGDILEAYARIRRYRRDEEIYGAEEPADSWYRVVSGVARKFAVQSDGRRRIVDFLLPGDFFGFTALSHHHFSVEAVLEDTMIASYARDPLEALALTDPRLGRTLSAIACSVITRLQSRILIFGGVTAQAKVALFLREMAARSQAETADQVFLLPMSRYDIADYLALSVETVSRALTRLRRCGAIALVGRNGVRIADLQLTSDGPAPAPPAPDGPQALS